jgi:vesicle-associated membrane protein-associated protein A
VQLYCVRPNAGRIEPGESVCVTVHLHPMNEEPPSHAICQDKFLVQSMMITPNKENMSLAEIVCVPVAFRRDLPDS